MANYPYTHPASQWGPPPFTGQQWAPPAGPPPTQWQPPPVPPPGFGGGWQPPTGPPPPTNDHARPYPGHYGTYTQTRSVILAHHNSQLKKNFNDLLLQAMAIPQPHTNRHTIKAHPALTINHPKLPEANRIFNIRTVPAAVKHFALVSTTWV